MGFTTTDLKGYSEQLCTLVALLQPLEEDLLVQRVIAAIEKYNSCMTDMLAQSSRQYAARSIQAVSVRQAEEKYAVRKEFSLKHQVACIFKSMLAVKCLAGFEEIFTAAMPLNTVVIRCIGQEGVDAMHEATSADEKCVELLAHVLDALLKAADGVNDQLEEDEIGLENSGAFIAALKAFIKVFSTAVVRIGLDESRSIAEVVAEVSAHAHVDTPDLSTKKKVFEAKLKGPDKQRKAACQYQRFLVESRCTVYQERLPAVGNEALGMPALVPEEWSMGH